MKIRNDADGIVFSEAYSGINVETPSGRFGIAQRDNGIEVLQDGKLVWSSEHPEVARLAMYTALETKHKELQERFDALLHGAHRAAKIAGTPTEGAEDTIAPYAAERLSRALAVEKERNQSPLPASSLHDAIVEAKLKEEIAFFDKNITEWRLHGPFNKKPFILIKGSLTFGMYESFEKAYKEGCERFGNAPILIRDVTRDYGVPVAQTTQSSPKTHDLTLRELQTQLPWTIHYHHDFRTSPMAHKDFGHALLHVVKATGKLSEIVNNAEHKGSEFKPAEVDPYIADLVVCALRLANTIPGRILDLQQAVEKRIEMKNGVTLKRK